MRNHGSGFIRHFGVRATVLMATVGCLLLGGANARAADGVQMPKFLSPSQIPQLNTEKSPSVAEDEAVMRAADEARRRAEEERLRAVEIRRQAEALSQRFAAELSAGGTMSGDSMSVASKGAGISGAANTAIMTGSIAKAPVADPSAERAEQAQAELKDAREALARARAELEAATARAREASEVRVAAEEKSAEPEVVEEKKSATAGKMAGSTGTSPKHAKARANKVERPDGSKKQATRVAKSQPAETPAATAAARGSVIAEPTMGLTSDSTMGASAAANPIAGLLSKVFGGGKSDPPVAAFSGQ